MEDKKEPREILNDCRSMDKNPLDLKSFKGKAKKNELKEAMRKFQEEMPNILENMALIANLTKAKYDSLVKEGFTPTQAIELCKKL